MSPFPSPSYLSRKVYPAKTDRQFIGDIFSPGVIDTSHLAATPASASRGVTLSSGTCYIAGNQGADQGTYRAFYDVPTTLVIDPCTTYPRIDQIIARIYDSEQPGSTPGVDQSSLEIVKGVEATDANLTNRNGAATLFPPNYEVLYDVLAPVGTGSLSAPAIADRRRPAKEASHGKAYFGIGSSTAASGADPPFGTMSQTVPGAYSLANGDQYLTVTQSGLYMVSITVVIANQLTCVLVRKDTSPNPTLVIDSMPAGTGTQVKTFVYMGHVEAAGYFSVRQTYSAGGFCSINDASIARIGA